jgi:hypothetical protein
LLVRVRDPTKPWTVCRQHPCPSEPLRLRWRGVLALCTSRTGRPVCIGVASTSAIVRKRRRLARTLVWGLTQPVVASRLKGCVRSDIVRCRRHRLHRAAPPESGYWAVVSVPRVSASGRRLARLWLHESRRCSSGIQLCRPRLARHKCSRPRSVWRPSSTGPARHSCPRRSSDQLACLYRHGFDVSYPSKVMVS